MARPIGSKSKPLILSTVEKLIAAQGVNNFSLQDIAQASGLSAGTIYYHYASKDAIIFDVISRHLDGLKEEYTAWIRRHPHDLTPERFLDIIFYKGVKLFNRAKVHIFLINECLSDNSLMRQRFVDKYREWQMSLLEGVKIAFPDIENSEPMAHLLLLILDGLVVQEVLRMPEHDPKSLIEIVKKAGKGKHDR